VETFENSWNELVKDTITASLCYTRRLFRKAKPEFVFKYFSKSNAFFLSLKAE